MRGSQRLLCGWLVVESSVSASASCCGVAVLGSKRIHLTLVRRLAADLNEFPWQWTAAMFDEWLGDRRSVDGHARSTVRVAGLSVRMFCAYLVDPAYGWQPLCEQRFQTFPIQVAHEWNTAPHVQQAGSDRGVRPFSHVELQSFFDCADDWVERARRSKRKGATSRMTHSATE